MKMGQPVLLSAKILMYIYIIIYNILFMMYIMHNYILYTYMWHTRDAIHKYFVWFVANASLQGTMYYCYFDITMINYDVHVHCMFKYILRCSMN